MELLSREAARRAGTGGGREACAIILPNAAALGAPSQVMTAPGTQEEFTALVAQYYERVFAVVFRLVGDREEAEDLTQDTFVNAYRFRGGFRGDSQVYTWLHRIAVNLTRNRLEQRSRRAYREALPTSLGAWEKAPADSGEEPDRELANLELGQAVARAVLQLRPEYREVVILRDYEGLSYQQIAALLGTSVPTVKTRLFRARGILRRRLAPYLEV